MITLQDLYNIARGKITNETGKAIIRSNFPPHIAEQMCIAIDGHEKVDHFQRFLKEYNDWMVQKMQQAAVIEFLRVYKG